jgi:hypothetical protein
MNSPHTTTSCGGYCSVIQTLYSLSFRSVPRNLATLVAFRRSFTTLPCRCLRQRFLGYARNDKYSPCHPERNAVEPKDPIGLLRTPFVGSFGFAYGFTLAFARAECNGVEEPHRSIVDSVCGILRFRLRLHSG